MGHRNTFNRPQILDNETSQGRNHTEQPHMLMGRTSASESSSLVHSGENININSGPFPSPWTTAPRSRINSSSISNAEMPYFQQQAPRPSRDPFLHQTAGGNFHMAPDSYSHLPSSSRLSGQTVPEEHGNFVNQATIGRDRGSYKRKSPSTPQLYDRGSTSRYYDAGSSSNLLLPTDPWQEKQNTEPYHMPWEYAPGNRVNNLSIGGEGMHRNVRSRTVVDHPNLSRTHFPNNCLHRAFSHRPSYHSNLVHYSGQTSNTSIRDRNHCLISPAGHGGTRGADSSSVDRGPNTLNRLNSYANNSVESGGYSNSASIPQNNYGYLNESRREVQSSYYQRPAPAFGASSFYPYQVAGSGEGPVMPAPVIPAGNFPSRHPQAIPTVGFRYRERNVRTGIPNGRYRSAEESRVPYQVAPEVNLQTAPAHYVNVPSLRNSACPAAYANCYRDVHSAECLCKKHLLYNANLHPYLAGTHVDAFQEIAANNAMYYGSITRFDQHRDLRLDVDNMSYEELLDLGERIGSVSTGLSDGLVSKCLTQSIYCSPDQSQEDRTCVICLEEYKDKDEVGTLKCGHDFHVGCIRKWLAMKNSCPICKASAIDDSMKEEPST